MKNDLAAEKLDWYLASASREASDSSFKFFSACCSTSS